MFRALIALLSLAVPAAAGDFSLLPPIDCDLGGPCYIQQYVDHDPSDAASDFTCAGLTYDGHKGTDFALPDRTGISRGVDVLASATGTVKGLRDGLPDTGYSDATADAIKNRECGNGVVLQHDGGWETQYCHMRKGSISVRKGQTIAAGDVLGQVGMSGRAEFPHVHLSVRQDGRVIDPFDPDGKITCGTPDDETLWSDAIPYRAGGIISIGTSTFIPDFAAIRAGNVAQATSDSGAMVIWSYLFGSRKSDVLRLSLRGPDGQIVSRDILLKRQQAQVFRAIGKKRRAARWPAGNYAGSALLLRDGKEIDRKVLSFNLR